MIRFLVVDNHDSFVFNVVQLLREHPRVSYTLISEDELKGDEMLCDEAHPSWYQAVSYAGYMSRASSSCPQLWG